MNTTGQLIEIGRRRRRNHSAYFIAEAVGACQQPGVSVAAVPLARGLNAAMLHRWVRQAERSGKPIAIRTTAPSVAIEGRDGFVPQARSASRFGAAAVVYPSSGRRQRRTNAPRCSANS